MAREQTCCFTGHRVIPQEERSVLSQRLTAQVRAQIANGVTDFYAGGALGFDTLAALTVLALKKEFPQIRLLLALPCCAEEQTRSWSEADKRIYELILASSDEKTVLSEHYWPGCMHVRNRYMVDRSSVCICYLTKNKGGTASTVAYAQKKGLAIVSCGE